MAIGKLSKVKGGSNLLEYLLCNKDCAGRIRDRHDVIYSTVGFDPVEINRHLDAFAALRPKLLRNTIHNSIRLSPDDRSLTDAEWRSVADFWATRMRIDGYLAVCHNDHIHIIGSRNRIDGSVVNDSGDYRESEKLIREIERRFDLVPLRSSHLVDGGRRSNHIAAKNRGELELAARNTISVKSKLQEILSDLTSTPITATDFTLALEALGIDVRPNIDPIVNELRGFSFAHLGYIFRGSTLGGSFTVPSMIQRGFSYDKGRDLANLIDADLRSRKQSNIKKNDLDVSTDLTSSPLDPSHLVVEAWLERDQSNAKSNFSNKPDVENDKVSRSENEISVIDQLIGSNNPPTENIGCIFDISQPAGIYFSEQQPFPDLPDAFKNHNWQDADHSSARPWRSYSEKLKSQWAGLSYHPLLPNNADLENHRHLDRQIEENLRKLADESPPTQS